MEQERKGARTPENETDKPRDAGAAERIEQRRQLEKDIDQREDEGWGDPESSAQKNPPPGPQP
jgi:hypothetical protein